MQVTFSEGFVRVGMSVALSSFGVCRGVSRFEHMKVASGLRFFFGGGVPRLRCLGAYLGSEHVAGPEISLRKAS